MPTFFFEHGSKAMRRCGRAGRTAGQTVGSPAFDTFVQVMSTLPEDIQARLREEIARRDLELLELKQRGQRNTSVLEVVVDRRERNVTLDEITELTRWTSQLLDEVEDALPGRYRLEVSSAGLARPLEHRWQFQKNVGRLMSLTVRGEDGATQTHLVRLTGVSDSEISIEPVQRGKRSKRTADAAALQQSEIGFESIVKAVIEPEI